MTDTPTAPGAPAGEGTQTPAGQGVPPAVPTPAPATPPSTWYNGADELTTGYIQNKGWKDPIEAVRSYQNLEKLLGADKAGNAVILPKPDATPEELGAFYTRLGRPSDAKDYKINLPEGTPTTYADGFRSKAFELGLTAKQVEGLAEWNQQYVGTTTQEAQAAKAAALQAEQAELQQAWGSAYTQELAKAQAAARGLGVSPEVIDKLSDAMGHKATMEFFRAIGNRMGEAEFVAGDKREAFGSALTPEQAKSQIESLKSDKDFMKKYVNGDAEARLKMERLHQFAFPEVKP